MGIVELGWGEHKDRVVNQRPEAGDMHQRWVFGEHDVPVQQEKI
jgi:hypothetical protein